MSNFIFNASSYGPLVDRILGETTIVSLGPGTTNSSARLLLNAFNPLVDLGQRPSNHEAAKSCHSGLWLFHNELDESHKLSQDLETPEGKLWHAIMHRREPDAWNSKYWWRQVNSHPVLKSLVEHSPALGYTYTNPQDFVDYCERVRDTATPDEEVAKRVQVLEWQLLFDHCYRKTTS